jgi:hypothetical protein
MAFNKSKHIILSIYVTHRKVQIPKAMLETDIRLFTRSSR